MISLRVRPAAAFQSHSYVMENTTVGLGTILMK